MTIIMFSPFKNITKRSPIITSRPIFQHASSFINDDDPQNGLEKQHPVPLFHSNPQPQQNLTTSRRTTQSRLHMILHTLITIFTTTSLILIITVVPVWNANFHHTNSVITSDYTDGVALAPLFLSLLTTLYVLLKEHTAQLQQPATPTVKPTTLGILSLSILATLAPALALSAINSLAWTWRSPIPTKTGAIICNLNNVFARQCQPVLYRIGGLQIGGIVTGGVVWLLWAVMLIVAVREWARTREEKGVAREKRHARRRGHTDPRERKPAGTEKTTCNGAGMKERDRKSSRKKSRGHGRQQHSRPCASTRSNHCCYEVRYNRPRVGSPAAREACNVLRPSQTIQSWRMMETPNQNRT